MHTCGDVDKKNISRYHSHSASKRISNCLNKNKAALVHFEGCCREGYVKYRKLFARKGE